MAEIKLYEELKGNFNVEKEQPYKFIQTLALAEDGNKELLSENNIKLKPSQWSVLAVEPEVLKKTVLRAKDLGFLDAYVQNPAFLKQDVDAVVKRMSEAEALGIPYKNEKGKYLSFIFSLRGYAYMKAQATGVTKEASNEATTVYDVELKEAADRVMEAVALQDEREAIYAKLASVEKEGLSVKETLIEVFKTYSDNLEFLVDVIDQVLSNTEEQSMGRVA